MRYRDSKLAKKFVTEMGLDIENMYRLPKVDIFENEVAEEKLPAIMTARIMAVWMCSQQRVDPLAYSISLDGTVRVMSFSYETGKFDIATEPLEVISKSHLHGLADEFILLVETRPEVYQLIRTK